LFWALYFFACLLREFSTPKALGFAAFCVLSVYTHYGAVFPVASLAATLLFFYAAGKQWPAVKKLLVVMFLAAAVFGGPLYFGFVRYQIGRTQTEARNFAGLFGEIQDFAGGVRTNLPFLFPAYYSAPIVMNRVMVLGS
jgi:hypothetical protein